MLDEDQSNVLLRELSQQFREQWSILKTPSYEAFLERVPKELRTRLIVTLIQDELELAISRTTQEFAPSDIHEDDRRAEPRLEFFLLRYPELRRSFDACRDLAIFEFAIRRNTLNPIEIEHYLEILPEYAPQLKKDLIRTDQKLHAHALMPDRFEPSRPGDSTVPDAAAGPIQTWRLPKQLGNFQLLSLLGQGGMGTVFRALDLRTGGVCAVKVMRRTDSWSVYRFNEEFRSLSSLDHPNIAKLFESFSDHGVRYFSMELIEGGELRRWWGRRNRGEQWDVLKQILWQIALSIQFLHNRGITHGDLKPGNVMVTRRGRAVLLDLGLATFVDDLIEGSRHASERLVGSLNYMAPEVILGKHVTRESDWYGFGAIIWELLQGEPPNPPSFESLDDLQDPSRKSTLIDQLRSELERTAAPAIIQELCLDLLNPDEYDRPKANEVLDRLRIPTRSAWIQPSIANPAPFVGRSEEIRMLHAFLHSSTKAPGSRLVLLEGDQGLGRTRLTEEWLRQCSLQQPSFILRAACNFKDGAPFHLINSLVQSFVGQWIRHGLEPFEESPSIQSIAKAFPQFSQVVDTIEDNSIGPSPELRDLQAIQSAAASFIRLICDQSHQRSLFIAIDNAEYADNASLRVLLDLWRHPSAFAGTLIAVYATKDAPKSPEKDALYQELFQLPNPPQCLKHALAPLTPQESAQIAEHLLTRPGMPVQVIDTLAQGFAELSHGNPQLLHELIHSFYENDPTGNTWGFRMEEMRGQDVERFRFRRLRRESRQIIEFLAVTRVPVSFQQLQIATRVGPERLFPYLGDLASQNWIEWQGVWPDVRLGLLNQDLQERVLRWTPADCIQRRHARLAQSLVLEVEKQWPEIAFHFEQAGKMRRATDAYLEAANQAIGSGKVEDAVNYVAKAASFDGLNRHQRDFVQQIRKKIASQC